MRKRSPEDRSRCYPWQTGLGPAGAKRCQLVWAGAGIPAAPRAGDDEADIGAKAYEREHELAANRNAQDLLDQGERALHRINAGTYGVCESCGKPIGKGRLLAFPRATLCVECKQRQERR